MDSLDELRAAKKDLEQAGVTIDGMSDYTASQSLYRHDPDGNEVELYADINEAVWNITSKLYWRRSSHCGSE